MKQALFYFTLLSFYALVAQDLTHANRKVILSSPNNISLFQTNSTVGVWASGIVGHDRWSVFEDATSSKEWFTITKGGNVGIGFPNPTYKLAVNGKIHGELHHKSGYFTWSPYNYSYDDGSLARIFYDGNRKQLRFWNSDAGTNFTRLETGGLSIGSFNPVSSTNGFENKIEFINGGHGAIVFHPGGNDELMFGMHQDGNFYWGRGRSHLQNPSDYSMCHNGINGDLGIKGKLTSNEVKVKIGGWADYVFFKNYKLPALSEVEQHIKEKGGLINIPSAQEVQENGIYLGNMNRLLLEKIEELTLYTIEQEKRIETNTQLSDLIAELQVENARLLDRIINLENKNP